MCAVTAVCAQCLAWQAELPPEAAPAAIDDASTIPDRDDVLLWTPRTDVLAHAEVDAYLDNLRVLRAVQRGADGSESEAGAPSAPPALAVSDSSLSIGGLSQEHCLECLRECNYCPSAARDTLACRETSQVTWNKVRARTAECPRTLRARTRAGTPLLHARSSRTETALIRVSRSARPPLCPALGPSLLAVVCSAPSQPELRKFNVSLKSNGELMEDFAFEANLRLVQQDVRTKTIGQVVHYFYLRGPRANLAQSSQATRVGAVSPALARTATPTPS